jgi:hypothetical protein
MENQTATVMNETNETEVTSVKKAPDYSRFWDSMRMNLHALGLDPVKTPGRLLDSGVLLIKRWKGAKASITLYVRRDQALGIKAAFHKTGKSISARVSECDVPGYLTVAEYAERMAKHGYLRLRQPRTESSVKEAPTQKAEQAELPIDTMAAAI